MKIINLLFPKSTLVRKEQLSGGDINQCSLVVLNTGEELVIKNNNEAPSQMFQIEANSLKLLSNNGLMTPEVISFDQNNLILKYYSPSSANYPLFEINAAQQLAFLHQKKGAIGLDFNNYIGTLPQNNSHHSNWIEFFIQNRIMTQLNIAKSWTSIDTNILLLFENFCSKLENIIPNFSEGSLLHGDLWIGNIIHTQNSKALFIDPAIYYGHHEVDLAFSQMFGSFSPLFYETYHEINPIDKEFKKRKMIYNIYPLLCHFNLFHQWHYFDSALNSIQKFI